MGELREWTKEGKNRTEECSFERMESKLNLSGLSPLFVGIQKSFFLCQNMAYEVMRFALRNIPEERRCRVLSGGTSSVLQNAQIASRAHPPSYSKSGGFVPLMVH